MKAIHYIVAALVVWAVVQVVVLNVCVSLINARIKELDTKVELHAAVTRLIDERSKDTQARMIRLEQRSVSTAAAIMLLNAKLDDPLGNPDCEPTVDQETGK